MPYKDPEDKRAKDREYYKERASRLSNLGQGRKYMKDRNRPKLKLAGSSEVRVGLTQKEIDLWCERITRIRTAMLAGVFKPEVRRWRGST